MIGRHNEPNEDEVAAAWKRAAAPSVDTTLTEAAITSAVIRDTIARGQTAYAFVRTADLIDKLAALASRGSSPEPPDVPYSQYERVLGYGTTNDPRAASSQVDNNRQERGSE